MTGRARLALLLIALLAIVAVVYAPVKRGVFVLGDRSLVEANPLVEHGTPAQIFTRPYAPVNPLTESRPVYYRPLTMLSLRADYEIGGLEPGSYHVTNLLLHLCATIALLLTARRLGASPAAATVAASVWALVPRSTECVAWVSGRADVLAATFAIAAIGLWPWYGETGTQPRGARARATLAGFAVMCGLLAKEVAVAAAFAIAVGTVAGTRGSSRERARAAGAKLLHLAVPLAIYAGLRWSATRRSSSHIAPLGTTTRAQTFLEAVGRYVEMTLDPFHPATTIGLASELDTKRMVLGGLALAGGAALAARAVGRRRAAKGSPAYDATEVHVAVGSALGLVALALVVHVVPIVVVSAVAADRLLYLPLAGAALALAVASARLAPRHRRLAGGAALALAATFVPVTRARVRDYTDDLQFRVAAAEHAHPHNTSSKRALGLALVARGEVALACRMQASASRMLAGRGAPARPLYLHSLETLAACDEVLGDFGAAGQLYAEVLAARPDARIHLEIGFLFLHAFAFDDADASLRRALALDVSLAPARDTLAVIPALRREAARLGTEEARRADRIGWARLLTDVGRVREATQAWLECALDPATPDDVAFAATELVIQNGELEAARRVVASYATRKTDNGRHMRANILLAARTKDRATVEALRDRLEALAAQ
ncbi:MAG: hypothetical protein JWP87_5801 [Labilithrix sp.]|nr:hypothetical protein [Labilithrix sp.]